MSTSILFTLIIGGLVGAVAGYIGSFMVVKRMSLVGDALSHVALPGMAIALLLSINPMLGAFVSLSLAVIGIWYLSEHSEIYPEALVGVFFTTSLAIGILITPEPELLETLFGSISKISVIDGLVILAATIVIFVIIKLISKQLLLGIVSEDLAKSSKINTSLVNLVYLFAVGMVVAIGVKFIGTLLMGALVIIPAVTAKNLTSSIKSFQTLSIFLGIISAVVGILISSYLRIESGPPVVLTGVFLFIASYFIISLRD